MCVVLIVTMGLTEESAGRGVILLVMITVTVDSIGPSQGS